MRIFLFIILLATLFLSQLETKDQFSISIYNYESETILSKTGEKDTGKILKIEAKITMEILHRDIKGNNLARYRLIECVSGWCKNNYPDIFVDFHSNDRVLHSLFIANKSKNEISWNILFAIINSIYSDIDGDSRISTPYGECSMKVEMFEDMNLFIRHICNCDFQSETDSNLLTISNQNFDQFITYKVKNSEIVEFESVESIKIGTDLQTVKANTVSKLRFLSQNLLEIGHCNKEMSAKECAKKNFKLNILGSNWAEIMKNLNAAKLKPKNSFSEIAQYYRKSHQISSLFTKLVQSGLQTSDENLKLVLNDPENRQILPILSDVFSTIGTLSSHKIARKFFEENHILLENYITTLAYAINISNEVLEDLQNWLNSEIENNRLRMTITMTLANLLKRKCRTSIQQKDICNSGRDELLNRFISHLSMCQESNTECLLSSLITFENLASPLSLPFARQFVCQNGTIADDPLIRIGAIRVIATLPSKYYDQLLLTKLISTFQNDCPQEIDSTSRTLAVEILLRTSDTHPSVLRSLLNILDSNRKKDNPEILAYFYAMVEDRKKIQPNFKNSWRHFRSSNFFTDFEKQTLSSVYRGNFIDMNNLKADYGVSAEFSNGNFKRSMFQVSMITDNGTTRHPILSLAIRAHGLDDLLGMDNIGTDNPSDRKDPIEPSAGMQLGFFGALQKPVTFFAGQGELMSAVWNADGKSLKAYEANTVLNLHKSYTPLSNGLILSMDCINAISLKMTGSIEISIWYRTSNSVVSTDATVVSETMMTLISPTGDKLDGNQATLKSSGRINFVTDVDFYQEPYKICMRMDHSPVEISQTYAHDGGNNRAKTRKTTIPGATFASHAKVQEMCKIMHHNWESDS